MRALDYIVLIIKELKKLKKSFGQNVKRNYRIKKSRRYNKNNRNERFQSPFMSIESFP